MLPNLDFTKPICVDLETISFNKSRGGLDPFNGDKIGMVAIAQGDKAYSYLLRSNVARSSCVPFEEFKKEFSEWLLEVQHLVNQNIKFDLRFLHCEGYKLRKDVKLEDTMVLARIRRNDMPEYNLDYLTHRFCKKYKKIGNEIAAHLKEIGSQDYGDVDPVLLAKYAELDVLSTLELRDVLLSELPEKSLEAYKIDCDFLPYLLQAECDGIKLDSTFLLLQACKLIQSQIQLSAEMDQLMGYEFNPNSSAQIDAMFQKLKVPPVSYTESGAPSWDSDALKTVAQVYPKESQAHQAASKLIEYKEAGVAESTFCRGWREVADANQVVHPNYNLAGTYTGRLSSNHPNVQNPPKWLYESWLIPDGYVGVSWDLSQIEYRIFVHYAQEQWLLDAYAADPATDLHQIVADALGLPRSPVKSINFGVIYGMGQAKMRRTLSANVMAYDSPKLREKLQGFVDPLIYRVPLEGPIKQAVMDKIGEAILSDYHKRTPSIKRFQKDIKSAIYDSGRLRNFYGMYYYFDPDKSYIGLNYLCQGSAAYFFKKKVVECLKAAPYAKMVTNIHDSLKVIVPTDKVVHYVNEVLPRIKDAPFRVPILYDVEVASKNWGNDVKLTKDTTIESYMETLKCV